MSARAERTEHECLFMEEETPAGDRIFHSCLVCGYTALEALEQLAAEAKESKLRRGGSARRRWVDSGGFWCGLFGFPASRRLNGGGPNEHLA